MKPKFKEIISTKNCPADNLCDSFIFEPEKEELELGTLVVLMDIEGKRAETEASSWLANIVAYKAKNSFYSEEVNDTVEAMQQACVQLNEKLRRLSDSGELDWVADLNVALVAFSPEGTLIISRIGDISVFLKQQGVFRDLEEELSSSRQKGDYKYIFQEIARGKLEKGGQLALLSSQFRYKFEDKKLRALVKKIAGLSSFEAEKVIKKQGVECFASLVCEMTEPGSSLISADKLSVNIPVKKSLKSISKIARFTSADSDKKKSSEGISLWTKIKRFFSKIPRPKRPSFCPLRGKSFSQLTSKVNKKILISGLVLVCLALIAFLGLRQTQPQTAKPDENKQESVQLPDGTKQIADLSQRSLSFRGRFVTSAGEGLYAANSEAVLSVVDSTTTSAVFSESSEANFSHKVYHAGKNKIYYFTPPQILSVYDLGGNEFTNLSLSPLPDQQVIAGIDYYEDNIYLLDSKAGMIVKYTDMNTDNPKNWLGDEAASNLENIISFAIDGSIYILDKNQGLGEYRLGQKIDRFKLATGSLSTNAQLFTRDSLQYLYLFDPRSSEVKILNKSQKEVTKTIKTVEGAIDFTVGAEEKNAYVITKKNKIYRIDLSGI